MKCEQALVLMQNFIDECLPEKEKQALLAHMSHCDACRQTFAELNEAEVLLRSYLKPVAEVPDLTVGIMAMLKQEPNYQTQTVAAKEKASWLGYLQNIFNGSFTPKLAASMAVLAILLLTSPWERAEIMPVAEVPETPAQTEILLAEEDQFSESTNIAGPEQEDIQPPLVENEVMEPAEPVLDLSETATGDDQKDTEDVSVDPLNITVETIDLSYSAAQEVVQASVELTRINDLQQPFTEVAVSENGDYLFFATQEGDEKKYWQQELSLVGELIPSVDHFQASVAMLKIGPTETQLQDLVDSPWGEGDSFVASSAQTGNKLAVNLNSDGEGEQGLWIVDLGDGSMEKVSSFGGGDFAYWVPGDRKIIFNDLENQIFIYYQVEDFIIQINNESNLDLKSMQIIWEENNHNLILLDPDQGSIYLLELP